MLTALALAVGLAVVVTVAFVIEPLLRPEKDLQELDSRRRGRDRGEDAVRTSPEWQLAAGRRRCPACGRRVERPYAYCEDCLCPVPT